MKNKKGFTLVELLAVIAILAVLMLLIMPNILKMFNKGKEGAFKVQIESLIKTADMRVQSDILEGKRYYYYCENDYCSKELALQNADTDTNYFIFIENGKATKMVVENKDYCYIGDAREEIRTEGFTPGGKIELVEISSTGGIVKCGEIEAPFEIPSNYVYWNAATAGAGVHYSSNHTPETIFTTHQMLDIAVPTTYPNVHARHKKEDENTFSTPAVCMADPKYELCIGAWIIYGDFEYSKYWLTNYKEFDNKSCTETANSITCRISNASCTVKMGEKAYCTDTVHTCTILPNEEIWCD